MTTEVPTRREAPTLEAVAAEAGVSRSTVSRVVNGSVHVSPDVVLAVNAAIERLNYIPNRAARSLANRRTMAIALVVPEDAQRFFGDPFFSEIMQGITNVIEDSDYVLNLQLARPTAPSAKTIRYLLGGNVDGAIVVSHHSGDEFFTTLDSTIPVVFGGRPFHPDAHGNSFVDVDNEAAGALGTQHLIDLGRRRIATISGPSNMQAALDRHTGWRRALEDAGLDASLVATGDFTMAGGAAAMRELLDREPALDGVFVASDLMATGAISVLRSRGRRVPEDVAVVGFDDSPAATSGEVGITTVHQPSRQMGTEMARMLLDLLDGVPTERERVLPTRLVIRDSA
ncbi:DNA-binding LacI/PurR family transcriptional regulator [Microbacteriaceae bacterium SG_E_30_P1]|uniref:DNA-binding LacI/PurR family transcriptional regulator n=1 Tax=Antiquaquibacter oligotrophicus TaxID=2880260 RepID=A0ABT6KQS6_9MICO|nr:LacI family DNA-binding transcriptional regulator [Antiquaquibacter oligotrophicus]MDH6182194.1 DNA-binding LacI/PurR family transcriptional regulator [Antiquaquibacter oligotrophicus]UDF12146.1 LacI family transcriptional regulator [Antiquaquibacter oligotrophicus]